MYLTAVRRILLALCFVIVHAAYMSPIVAYRSWYLVGLTAARHEVLHGLTLWVLCNPSFPMGRSWQQGLKTASSSPGVQFGSRVHICPTTLCQKKLLIFSFLFGNWLLLLNLIFIFYLFLFFKDFIYLLLERGREGEEREINVWLPLVRPLLGAWPTTQACAIDRESNWWCFGCQAGTKSTEPHQPGLFELIFDNLKLFGQLTVFY